jgi:hypothetical protein
MTVTIPDPQHRWTFDEQTGSVATDSTGKANGTLSQTATYKSGGAFDTGGIVHIDGSNDSCVNFGTSVGQFGTKDFTVMLWFRTSEKYRYFDLLGNRTAGSHGNFFCLRMTGKHESSPEGRVSVEVDENQQGHNYIAVSSQVTGLNDGKWHHVAAVREGASLKLYIDGVLSGESKGSGVANIANGNPFKLGRSLSPNVEQKFAPTADYDDLCLYDVALTGEQISAAIAHPEPSQSLTGEFQVVTTSDTGLKFTNTTNAEVTYTFTPSGKWMPAKAEMGIPECGPEGFQYLPEQYQKMLKYPEKTAFCLVAVNSTTNEETEVGQETKISLKPGETLNFLVNDIVGTYGDNTGTLKVSWSTPTPQPAAPEQSKAKATIYEDANYQGASQELTEGSYDIASLKIGNDRLSSLRVPAGLKVTLYEHANFSGRSKVLTQDTSWIGDDFNDITSSIKVEKIAATSLKATIYEDSNYQGASQELTEGSYDMASLKIGNDRLSSLRVPAGLKVTLYEHANFSGRSKVLTQDTSWIGDDFNDITSSIKVEKIS